MRVSITFTADGTGHCLHHEAIDLRTLGTLRCRRASRIEFSGPGQCWEVRTPDGGRLLFRSPSRRRCLAWERRRLDPLAGSAAVPGNNHHPEPEEIPPCSPPSTA
jgi:hypothetical protein